MLGSGFGYPSEGLICPLQIRRKTTPVQWLIGIAAGRAVACRPEGDMGIFKILLLIIGYRYLFDLPFRTQTAHKRSGKF